MDSNKLLHLVDLAYMGYPEAVKELGDNYGSLYDVLEQGMCAVQQIDSYSNKVDELESTVSDLEGEIGTLERAILTLEEELLDARIELNAARDELFQMEIDR